MTNELRRSEAKTRHLDKMDRAIARLIREHEAWVAEKPEFRASHSDFIAVTARMRTLTMIERLRKNKNDLPTDRALRSAAIGVEDTQPLSKRVKDALSQVQANNIPS